MIELTDAVIDVSSVLAQVQTRQAGAVVLFLGSVRQFTGGRETLWLDYECYSAMARSKLHECETAALRQWELQQVCVVHRTGRLEPGAISIAIAVSALHRQAAFAAGSWLIDEIKRVVPIWKQEHWADGTSQWVHPGGAVPGAGRVGDS